MLKVTAALFLVFALLFNASSTEAQELPERWQIIDLGPEVAAETMSLNDAGVVSGNQYLYAPILGLTQVLASPRPGERVEVLTSLDDYRRGYVGHATRREGGPASYCTEPIPPSPVQIPLTVLNRAILGQCGATCSYQSFRRTACAFIASAFFEEYVFDNSLASGADFAASINPLWRVVGGATKMVDSQTALRAFCYSPQTGMVDLGTLGGINSAARSINWHSQIVGEAEDAARHEHAFLFDWNSQTMNDLGTLGGNNSWARAINDNALIAGTSEFEPDSNQTHAFLYSRSTGMIDLNSTLPSGSGWVLQTAHDINESGEIAGYGTFNGERHGYFLSPFDTESRFIDDFDGDERGDFAVWRPASGTWFIRTNPASGQAAAITKQWGLPGDKPLRGDYDGDGLLDLVVWRPGNGTWYLCYSANNFDCTRSNVQQFGLPGDVPLSGDVDGDGKYDFIVWRPLLPNGPTFIIGQWYYLSSLAQEFGTFQWGLPGDIPLVADFDGDGRDDAIVFRPSTGEWFGRTFEEEIRAVGGGQWGLPGDHPVAADFDGDSRADVAVWRPSSGVWYIRPSREENIIDVPSGGLAIQFGLPGDKPIIASFDGNTAAEIAVWRPKLGSTEGTWYIRGIRERQVSTMQWGLNGDVPIGLGTKDR